MMVRSGHHALRYTHDFEAAVAEVLTYKEFDHLDQPTIETFIRDRDEWLGHDYFYNLEFDHFQDARLVGWYKIRPAEGEIKVVLYHFGELLASLLETCGFSCLLCGCVTAFPVRRQFFHWDIDRRLRERQKALGPNLVCERCVDAVNGLISPWPHPANKMLSDAMIARAEQNHYRRPYR